MNEREELQALRRLAELEQRAAGQERQQAARDYVGGANPTNPVVGVLGGLRHAWDRAAYGIGTMVPDVLPQGVRDAINASPIARGLGVALPSNDQMQGEVARGRAFIQEAGLPGMAGDIGGDVAISSVPVARTAQAIQKGAQALPRAIAALRGPVASNVAANAAVSAATSPDDRAAGAVGGAVGGAAGEVAGRVLKKALGGPVSDAVSPEARKLMDQGVFVPAWKAVEQETRSGRTFRNVAERARVLPVAGDVIRGQERRGIEDWNRLLVEGATPPTPVLDEVGRVQRWLPPQPVGVIGADGLRELGNRFDAAYGALYGSRGIPVDRQFMDDLTGILGATRAYTPGVADEVEGVARRVRDTLAGMTEPTVTRTGGDAVGSGRVTARMRTPVQTSSTPGHEVTTHGNVKKALDAVDDAIRSAWSKGDAEKAQALGMLRDSIDGLRARGLPPEVAGEARAINAAYSNFKDLQRAGSMLGAQKAGGVVTPDQMLNSIRARDRSVDKRAFAEGTARGQQDALDARAVFGSYLPEVGPGTAEKLLPVIGGGLPMVGFDAGATLLLGTQTGQRALTGALPGQATVRSSPYLTPAMSQIGAQAGEYRAQGRGEPVELTALRGAKRLGLSDEEATRVVARALAKE